MGVGRPLQPLEILLKPVRSGIPEVRSRPNPHQFLQRKIHTPQLDVTYDLYVACSVLLPMLAMT